MQHKKKESTEGSLITQYGRSSNKTMVTGRLADGSVT